MEDLYPPLWQLEDKGLWTHDDNGLGHESAAFVTQGYIRKFRPKATLEFEIALTCSKPRLDAFGGLAAFITKDEIRWGGTRQWLEKQ